MARMTVRSTYALDEQTAQRIRHLARSWDVSQAEVIRRSVRQAAELQQDKALTPEDVVARYRSGPLPRNKSETKRLSEQIRQLRHYDDERRGRGADA